MAVLLSALVVIQRAFATETVDGGRDGLRVAGLDPAGIFLGKGAAVAAVLLVLEGVLAAGVILLYGASLGHSVALVLAACVLATIGLVAPGMVFGASASGVRIRETLLPLLFLPVVAPVLIGATRAFEAAVRPARRPKVGGGSGCSPSSPSSTPHWAWSCSSPCWRSS